MCIRRRWTALRKSIDTARRELSVGGLHANDAMCRLLVVGEDRRLGIHPGVDPLALCRALWRTYGCGCREGGSTLAMQLARVLTGRYERTWRRKVDEMGLALLVTGHVPLSELPPLYLSVAYFGSRMNGLAQACSRLGIDPERCTLRDSALLVARLKYPQPKVCPPQRWAQISHRADYLIARLEREEGLWSHRWRAR